MSRIANWKYMTAVAVTIVGAVGLACLAPYSEVTGRASMLSGVIISVAGIGIGTGGFIALRQSLEASGVRLVCALVSGALGAGAGFVLGLTAIPSIWDALVFKVHPSYQSGSLGYQFLALVTMTITGFVSAVFGTGIGLPVGKGRHEKP